MSYSAKDVARLLELSPSRLRSLVKASALPEDCAYSFQDLVLLRAAKGLLDANLPAARIRRALARLRESLPDGRPLSGLALSAEGRRLVASDGSSRFEPESGQSLLDFEPKGDGREVTSLARGTPAAGEERDAGGWFDLGCELEARSPDEAREAYRRALALDPTHADAHVNLGRLLHEGDPDGAEAHYRAALAARAGDAVAAFNLGLVLASRGRVDEAIEAFQTAVRADPAGADAHYQLAQLYQRLGQEHAALRHLRICKKLTDGR